jgi:proline racemase
MRVTTLDAHVGGAAVRLITSGLSPLLGQSMAERRSSFDLGAAGIGLMLTREPRGHAGLVGVVLTEPAREDADAGMLFLTGAGGRSLSGHAALAAAGLALDHRLITPRRPDALHLDTEAGAVIVRVIERDPSGHTRRLSVEGPPAAVIRGNVRVTAARRAVKADLAWSGSEAIAIVEGEAIGVPLSAAHSLDLRRAALDIIAALEETAAVTMPGTSERVSVTACAFVGPASDLHADVRSVLVRADGTVSRSPSAGGTAAVTVVLAAMGLLMPGSASRHESLSGTCWTAEAMPLAGEVAGPMSVSIVAEVYPTGAHEFVVADGDPLPSGVRWT